MFYFGSIELSKMLIIIIDHRKVKLYLDECGYALFLISYAFLVAHLVTQPTF